MSLAMMVIHDIQYIYVRALYDERAATWNAMYVCMYVPATGILIDVYHLCTYPYPSSYLSLASRCFNVFDLPTLEDPWINSLKSDMCVLCAN